MAAFATYADLQKRMRRTLTSAEQTIATQLLDDASGDIRARFRERGWVVEDRIDAGLLTEDDLKVVACRAVKRAMAIDDDLEGIKTVQDTVGPFSGSATFANPMGDVYLTKADMRRLGLSGQVAGYVDMFTVPS